MDLLQLNKFGSLHDGRNILFCRTDYVQEEFKKITKLKHEVVLISGNSDLGIGSRQLAIMPDNISTWYCQNPLAEHEKLKVIPLGLENTQPSKRKGQGSAWPHAEEKLQLLAGIGHRSVLQKPRNLLYSNFNEQTNPAHRTRIKQMSQLLPYINWEEPSLGYQHFVDKVLDHEAVICPAGNGLDTHRIYEVIYCGRVAVTFKVANSPLYDQIYSKLPVIVLNHVQELEDVQMLKELIFAAQQKEISGELLDFGYWRKLILSGASVTLPGNKSLLGDIWKFFTDKSIHI